MPAIADIVIRKPPSVVWSVIADASSHPNWVDKDVITTYQGGSELAEEIEYTRLNEQTGAKTEGEVVAMRPGHYFKLRVDAEKDAFATAEYHLLAVAEGRALRVLTEVYDTGNLRHVYFPELAEQHLQNALVKLKKLCESA